MDYNAVIITPELANLEAQAAEIEPTLEIMVYGHELMYGNKKTHLAILDSGTVLCGSKSDLFSTQHSANREWVVQPDPEMVLCQRCKKIAVKHFDSIDMTVWHQEQEIIKKRAISLRKQMKKVCKASVEPS